MQPLRKRFNMQPEHTGWAPKPICLVSLQEDGMCEHRHSMTHLHAKGGKWMPASHKVRKRQERALPTGFQGILALQTPWFQTSSYWQVERNFVSGWTIFQESPTPDFHERDSRLKSSCRKGLRLWEGVEWGNCILNVERYESEGGTKGRLLGIGLCPHKKMLNSRI
jgi:hypothetical protein